MYSVKDVYVRCDELDNLPVQNKDNYIYELDILQKELTKNAHVLQVGSMDGIRIIRLLEIRPDLKLTGLEIEKELVATAEQNISKTKFQANFILGDITSPPANLFKFDYVICLNNTLGYIPNQRLAIEEIKRLAKIAIISVYGEKFDDKLAIEYFKSIGLDIERITSNQFILKDFSSVTRYTRKQVASWGGNIIETPIGYFCVFNQG